MTSPSSIDTKTKKLIKIAYYVAVTTILLAGVLLRILIFDKQGGDYLTYKESVNLFHQGINPYIKTVLSFESNTGEHGYAYLPTLLYIQYGIWMLSNLSGVIVSTVILWKLPTLIAEVLIFLFLVRKGQKAEWPQKVVSLASGAFWVLNPYFIARYDYSLYDPVFLLFVLLALDRLETRPIASGIFYSLAISLKTIPVILLPLFILKTPHRVKFLAAGALVAVLISVPFMKSTYDFQTYIKGSLLVHSDRSIQGRPILTGLTYLIQPIGLTTGQEHFTQVYATLSILLALLVPSFLYYKDKIKDKYVWTATAFGIYLLLTPVLSRTHLLWILPWVLSVGIERTHTGKTALKMLVLLGMVWVSLFWYLFSWNKGFEVSESGNQKTIVIQSSDLEWELPRLLKHKYYEIRGKLF